MENDVVRLGKGEQWIYVDRRLQRELYDRLLGEGWAPEVARATSEDPGKPISASEIEEGSAAAADLLARPRGAGKSKGR